MMDKRKMTIRIGKNTLSFTLLDVTSQEQPVIYEPYIVKGGISMAANLREALKTVNLSAADILNQIFSIPEFDCLTNIVFIN